LKAHFEHTRDYVHTELLNFEHKIPHMSVMINNAAKLQLYKRFSSVSNRMKKFWRRRCIPYVRRRLRELLESKWI